jgi:RNA polymerase sigma-B factor
VTRYQWLVNACARRHRGSPELMEDLIQVGYVGLLKAINNFDPYRGVDLAAYARPTISGEIKRHFRDKRWQMHVTRTVQELRLEMRNATVELTQHLQRTPTDPEIARFLHISAESLTEVRGADRNFQPASLDAPVTHGGSDSPGELSDLIRDLDTRLDRVIDMEALAGCWPQLPPAEQRALLLRFYGTKPRLISERNLASPRCRSRGSSHMPSATTPIRPGTSPHESATSRVRARVTLLPAARPTASAISCSAWDR